MVRILPILIVVLLVFCMITCGPWGRNKPVFDVDACIAEVDLLVEAGRLEEAKTLLELGIREADDPQKLEEHLAYVQSLLDNEKTPEPETAPTTAITDPTAGSLPDSQGTQLPGGNPQTGNQVDSFNGDETYRINVFLSNFSEQNFQAYPCDEASMVDFAYMYCRINNREAVGFDEQGYYVSEDNINQVLERFFNRSVNGAEIPADNFMNYSDGRFHFMPATGEGHGYCSVATQMVKNADGTYTVDFDVYAHKNVHESMSSYYGLTPDQAAANSDLVYQYSGTAVVRDYTRANGVASYRLISYSR